MARYPLVFQPIFKERVWGGRTLAEMYGKPLPPGKRIGESWEITDRPEGVSVILNGPLAGKDLRWLMQERRGELLGEAGDAHGRFPLLVKLLDARDILSLQVHPPAARAAELGGEPKTEMWYVARAEPDAAIMAGVKPGITRERFAEMLEKGTAAEAVWRLPVREGDALFLPSGRMHALGAGLVVFEIQQNSDTTYRVFDWNRVGLDGRPRELHIPQALASIDFNDTEPALLPREFVREGPVERRRLVADPLFEVEQWRLTGEPVFLTGRPRPLVVASIREVVRLETDDPAEAVELKPGHFALVPAAARERTRLSSPAGAECLLAEAGRAS
ncbi:MAG: mannose-6-phosphate isomerase [Verrucomicrobia bacterium]|nr:MAG: mannose-6-phosphate isomerase [Verrucomicrobiota bacterium]